MSKKLFTEKEITQLSKNPYVKSVSSKGITYSDEFKQHFVSEFSKGKFSRQIFEEAGFDVEIIGMQRIKSSSERWRNTYKTEGLLGLKDTRKDNSGRQRVKELPLEEKYARLEAQMNLVKAENELLKKIHMLERGLKK
ncbi:tranposase [Bacillus weihaiensis]|uniref:Tranposase n=1 Tax=Bacillus weihaiensis TaxID=1547283 RepID=A0A1L3MP16_9BACI|nr:tranposase [Bacillus weihaiensis]